MIAASLEVAPIGCRAVVHWHTNKIEIRELFLLLPAIFEHSLLSRPRADAKGGRMLALAEWR